MIKYKSEIDSLRALSVILVVFFHFNLFGVSGGFIGVDIFFVISGYLITSLISQSLKQKNFSIIDFYNRRARRILPALYMIILISLVFGFFIFGLKHFERLQNSSLYSILGFSNFFFASEYSYFDFNKIFKPLLHTWSLSVELQFYLIWPFLIWFFYFLIGERIKYLILTIFLFSLIISTIYSQRSEAFFYFTPFRLYELSLGSLLFFFKFNYNKNNNDLLFFIGIIIIIFSSFLFTEKSVFPGFNALIPSFAAALILISGDKLNSFKKIFLNKFLILVGKMSYSIYLIHWPIFIFAQYLIINPLNFFQKNLLIIFVFLISYLSFRYIEIPFRKRIKNKYLISNFILLNFIMISVLVTFLCFKFINTNFKHSNISSEKKDILSRLSKEFKIRKNFEKEFKKKLIENNNLDKKKTKVLIFGDSHGLDLSIALSNTKYFSSLDIDYFEFTQFECFKKENFKDEIVKFIKKNLISFSDYCNVDLKQIFKNEIFDKSEKILITSRWTDEIDFEKMLRANKNFSSKKLIIMGRKPFFYHIPTLFLNIDQNINKHAFLLKDKKVEQINNFILEKSQENNLVFFDTEKLICKDLVCKVFDKDNLLLFDADHWSLTGSKYYGQELFNNNFLNMIEE